MMLDIELGLHLMRHIVFWRSFLGHMACFLRTKICWVRIVELLRICLKRYVASKYASEHRSYYVTALISIQSFWGLKGDSTAS